MKNTKKTGYFFSILTLLLASSISSFAQLISSLSYPTPTVVIANEQNVFLSPNISGNSISYSIMPTLPAGLSFDTNTGIISGMGTAASTATNYTITATGAQNSVNTILNFAVTNNYFNNNFQELAFGGTGVTVINGTTGTTISNTTNTTYGRTVGDKVVYKNVANLSSTQIDCIVTTVSSNVSGWTAYDMEDSSGNAFSGNSPKFFSPQITFPNNNGYLGFNFQFILGGSYNKTTQKGTNVVLRNVEINSYDIDGNGESNSNQSTNFGGFTTYELGNPTNMSTPTVSNGLTTFKSSLKENTVNALDPKNRVRVQYSSVSNFNLSFGGGGLAYFFAQFGAGPTFSTADTTTAPSIDLNTDLPGINNHDAGCGAALNFSGISQTNISSSTSNNFTQFSINFPTDEIIDGSSEELWITGTNSGTQKIPLNSNFSTGNTFTLGSINFNSVVASTNAGIRTIVFKKTVGTFTLAQAETLLDAMQYNNKANTPTQGDRNFTVNVATAAFQSPDAIFTAFVNCVSLAGNIYHDINGMVDGIVNGTGTSQFAANFMNAVLVNPTTNKVLAVQPIASGGAYSFGKVSPGNYAIYISTSNPNLNSNFTSSILPSSYISTGENLGSGAGTDLTTDGKLLITIGSSNITDANFGIQIPPTTSNKTISNIANPGGFNTYSTPTNSFTTNDADGQIDSITINSFPIGANYLKIGTTYYTNPSGGTCPPQATCTAWTGSVMVPFSGGNPTLVIAVDPTSEGNTSVVINFKAWDNAKAISNSSNLTLNYIGTTYKTITGNVWNDANGNGIKSTTEPLVETANTGETLYAVLIQTTHSYSGENTILNATPVDETNGYSFINVPSGNDYIIKIVSLAIPPINGAKASTISPQLANNWVGVSTNTDGTINAYQSTNNLQITLPNLITNQSNLNFGIEQLPESNSESIVLASNPAVNASFILDGTGQFPIPSGSDPEEGNLAAGNKIKFTTLPSNSNLKYNGVLVTLGQEIPNFNPSFLKIELIASTISSLSTEFQFAYIDNAKQVDPSPATYKITWGTPLPITFVSFTVTAENKFNQLNWQTATELNNLGFEVERSTDGTNWKNLGFIATKASNGNSSSSLSYSFEDNSPLDGRSFYRLQQKDENGKVLYSSVQLIVRTSSTSEISIAPNPTQGLIKIIGIHSTQTIRIFNSIGKTVSTSKAQDNTEDLDLSYLPNGVYFIVISDENGNNTSKKIIKR